MAQMPFYDERRGVRQAPAWKSKFSRARRSCGGWVTCTRHPRSASGDARTPRLRRTGACGGCCRAPSSAASPHRAVEREQRRGTGARGTRAPWTRCTRRPESGSNARGAPPARRVGVRSRARSRGFRRAKRRAPGARRRRRCVAAARGRDAAGFLLVAHARDEARGGGFDLVGGSRVHRGELGGQRRLVEERRRGAVDAGRRDPGARSPASRAKAPASAGARWCRAQTRARARREVALRWRASPGARAYGVARAAAFDGWRRARLIPRRASAERRPGAARRLAVANPKRRRRGAAAHGTRGEAARGRWSSGGRAPFVGGATSANAIHAPRGGGAPGAAWMYLQLSPRARRPFWKSRQMRHVGSGRHPDRRGRRARQEPRGRACAVARACIGRSGSRGDVLQAKIRRRRRDDRAVRRRRIHRRVWWPRGRARGRAGLARGARAWRAGQQRIKITGRPFTIPTPGGAGGGDAPTGVRAPHLKVLPVELVAEFVSRLIVNGAATARTSMVTNPNPRLLVVWRRTSHAAALLCGACSSPQVLRPTETTSRRWRGAPEI